MKTATGPMDMYIVYAVQGQDERHCDTLEKHLSVLKRQGEIVTRHERLVTAGTDVRSAVKGMLGEADLVVLLLSPDFIASDFCYNEQMEVAMRRHRENSARVIPVVLRPCYWEDLPVAGLQALPASRKAITSHDDQESAWKRVAKGIHAAVKDLRELRRMASTDLDAISGPIVTPPSAMAQDPVTARASTSGPPNVVAVRDAYRLLNLYHRDLFAIVRKTLQRCAKHTGQLRASGWGSTLFDLPVRRDKLPIDQWPHDYQPLAHAYFWWATDKVPVSGSVYVSMWHSGDDAVEKFLSLLPGNVPNPAAVAPSAESKTTFNVYVEAVVRAEPSKSFVDWKYVESIIESDSNYTSTNWTDGKVHECDALGLVRYGGFERDMADLLDLPAVDPLIIAPLGAMIDEAKRP